MARIGRTIQLLLEEDRVDELRQGGADRLAGERISRDPASCDIHLDSSGMCDLRFDTVPSREIDDELLREVLDLYNAAFGVWPFRDPGCEPLEYLRWKAESPGTPLAFLLGRRGSRLVLACTIQGRRIRVRGRSLLVLHYRDAAVHPSEQGRGVYTVAVDQMVGPCHPAHDLALDEIGVHPAMTRINENWDAFVPANPVRTLTKVLRPLRLAREWSAAWPGPLRWAVGAAAAPVAVAGGLMSRLDRRRARVLPEVSPVSRFDDRFEHLFESVAGDFDLICERTADHLNARFCDRRAGPFRVTSCQCEGKVLGYLVARVGASWQVADLLALRGREDVVAALLADAAASASSRGAAGISCWLPRRHPYRGSFRRAGFFDLRQRGGFYCRPVDLPRQELDFARRADARLHLMIGDSDLV
jgi:hypothetical protein